MALLEKIEKTSPTLRDIVQERMRTAIIEGHFAPGERLVERPLCEQLGVSRTVIRETIRFLEAEGLVESISNKGPIVARLNWAQANQIYDIRRQLEASAAEACAKQHDANFAEQLSNALRAIEATMSDTTWSDLLQATTDFYELIFLQAGHSIAWEVVGRLNGRISRLRALTISAKDRPRPGIVHLNAIHDAILNNNPDAARIAVYEHIDDASATAHKYLNSDSDVSLAFSSKL